MLRYAFIIICLLCNNGCYTYTPVEVRVVNGQSQEPLDAIEIYPRYLLFLEFFPPDLSPAMTDSDGIARLRICTNYKSGYAGLYFRTEDYRLGDVDHWGMNVFLPIEELRGAQDIYRVQIEMLTLDDYDAKYR